MIEKVCPKCRQTSTFHVGAWKCKTCANDSARANYHKRKSTKEGQEKIAEQRIREARFRWKRKQEAVEYMGNKCFDCNTSFPLPAYDFHHLDPKEKEGNPSHFINKRSDIRWKEELSKCVLLCANCHRIRHFEGGYLDDRSY